MYIYICIYIRAGPAARSVLQAGSAERSTLPVGAEKSWQPAERSAYCVCITCMHNIYIYMYIYIYICTFVFFYLSSDIANLVSMKPNSRRPYEFNHYTVYEY